MWLIADGCKSRTLCGCIAACVCGWYVGAAIGVCTGWWYICGNAALDVPLFREGIERSETVMTFFSLF